MGFSRVWCAMLFLILLTGCGPGENPPGEESAEQGIPAADSPTPSPFAQRHGPYLGEEPPGLTPRIFAPGLVATESDKAGMVVAPGGREIYYWTVEPGILEEGG